MSNPNPPFFIQRPSDNVLGKIFRGRILSESPPNTQSWTKVNCRSKWSPVSQNLFKFAIKMKLVTVPTPNITNGLNILLLHHPLFFYLSSGPFGPLRYFYACQLKVSTCVPSCRTMKFCKARTNFPGISTVIVNSILIPRVESSWTINLLSLLCLLSRNSFRSDLYRSKVVKYRLAISI